ncbi:hypothetical protein EIP91_009077 [Steccherinum ochraceum]|uniref:FAD-dependent oxidoreductase 2 FAD-binding domain-containing protein n=1 Tax=Steccherinum ochraceum TaxID=92696 RepID=A0A4R0S015_9APHY|nr:hypothetical protein EIP91_009077 [Steccherinum ochraceum]
MSTDPSLHFDCIVIGSGNAGSCAALSAKDEGCTRVLIVDKCPAEWVGGNGYFTAGAHRTVHDGLHDLLPIVSNVSPTSDLAQKIDMDPYSAEEFTEDIMRLSKGRSDQSLVKALVNGSREAIQWLHDRVKMPFVFSFHRQAYLVEGRQKFWGGMVLATEDGGKGVIAAHQKTLKEAGVEVWFETPAVELLADSQGAITGVVVRRNGELVRLHAPAVVLASGGYEASRDLRAQHLGEEWSRAKVRGTPFNTGDGIALARAVHARTTGDFEGCHSTCWDYDAPSDQGDRNLSNQYTKSGYTLGLMLNANGHRFVDEGEDFRNYTYAKFGKEILKQPGGYAWQVWDATAAPWLRKEEYGDGIVKKVTAATLDDLADLLSEDGLHDKGQFIATVRLYNDAVKAFALANPSVKWDPSVRDGLSTDPSLPIPKSNWALPITTPPFLAVKVTCGITFTFGGLAIDPSTAGVLSEVTGKPIRGLFCTGELVGGLFYGNYPGGSGLTTGAVFGRKAGKEAAKIVVEGKNERT